MLELHKLPVRPLSTSESSVLVNLMFASDEEVESMVRALTDSQNGYSYKIAARRAEWANMKVDSRVLIMVAMLARSPAQVVSMLYTISHDIRRLGIDMYSLSEWCHLFALGVPTEESHFKFWDSQKLSNSNSVDDFVAWGTYDKS